MWSVLFRLILRLASGAGKAGRVGQGARLAFTGLLRSRPLSTLTQQQIRNVMAKVGLREAHNAHFISRLVHRGPQFGINTLDDLARAINNGIAQPGKYAGTVQVVIPNGRAAIIFNKAGELVTFVPL